MHIKLSKAQISKAAQSGRFLRALFSKLAYPIMKKAAPIAKNILLPLRLTAAASIADLENQRKMHGSGVKLVTSNEEMQDIVKIIISLKDSGILIKIVTETIKNELVKGTKVKEIQEQVLEQIKIFNVV